MDRKTKFSKERRVFKPQKGDKNEKYKKFVGNKAEGQGFADKRKKKIQYEYMKMMKKERLKEQRAQSYAEKKIKPTHAGGHHHHERPVNTQQRDGSMETNSRSEIVNTIDSSSSVERRDKMRNKLMQIAKGDIGEASSSGQKPPGKFGNKPQFRKGKQANIKGVNRYTKAADEFKDREEKKQMNKQEHLQKKKQQDQAREAYQKKKKENFKLLCKKTRKGQPVMKNQIEFLLKKIEKQVNQR